jgi:hypothetical protein
VQVSAYPAEEIKFEASIPLADPQDATATDISAMAPLYPAIRCGTLACIHFFFILILFPDSYILILRHDATAFGYTV